MLDFSGHICGLHDKVTSFCLSGHCIRMSKIFLDLTWGYLGFVIDNYLRASPTLSIFVMIFVNGLCLFFFARSNLSQACYIIIIDCSGYCFDDFEAYFEAYFLGNVLGVRKFRPRFHPSDGYRVCPCCRLSL